MDDAEALQRLAAARVGRFASITPDGRPHVVVVTFTVIGLNVVHMIDEKPKTTHHLQRLHQHLRLHGEHRRQRIALLLPALLALEVLEDELQRPGRHPGELDDFRERP